MYFYVVYKDQLVISFKRCQSNIFGSSKAINNYYLNIVTRHFFFFFTFAVKCAEWTVKEFSIIR